MRRFAAVGDTHLPRFGRRLPHALLDGLREARVELILHAGDLTTPDVLEQLGEIAPVVAVAGNNDPPELHERLGTLRIVHLDGVRVGLTHGHLGRGTRTPDRALAAFDAKPVDIVVFGHSHIPGWERRGDVWLLNPGSPTDRRRMPAFSYGLVGIGDGTMGTTTASGVPVAGRIVWYADRSA